MHMLLVDGLEIAALPSQTNNDRDTLRREVGIVRQQADKSVKSENIVHVGILQPNMLTNRSIYAI